MTKTSDSYNADFHSGFCLSFCEQSVVRSHSGIGCGCALNKAYFIRHMNALFCCNKKLCCVSAVTNIANRFKGTIGILRSNTYAVTHFESFDALAHLSDDSCAFVTENYRCCGNQIHPRFVLKCSYIRMAKSGSFYINNNFTGNGMRIFFFNKFGSNARFGKKPTFHFYYLFHKKCVIYLTALTILKHISKTFSLNKYTAIVAFFIKLSYFLCLLPCFERPLSAIRKPHKYIHKFFGGHIHIIFKISYKRIY